MRICAGIAFILFGLAAFGLSVAKLTPGTDPAYIVGSLLPSSLIVVAGVYIMIKSKKA